MVVVGAVVVLEEGPAGRDALAALQGDPRLQSGAAEAGRVPIALEAPGAAEGRELLQQLAQRPGVAGVSVVCVIDEPSAETAATELA